MTLTAESCRTLVLTPEVMDAISRGEIEYDPVLAGMKAEQVRNGLGCGASGWETVLGTPFDRSGTGPVFRGALSPGSVCGSVAASQLVSLCRDGRCGDDGRCETLRGIGEACPGEWDRCVDFAQPLSQFYCVRGVCSLGAPSGAPCTIEADCESFDCRSGACFGPQEPGQPCRSARECRSFVCRLGVCTSKKGVGEPCEIASECTSFICADDARCAPAICGLAGM